MNKTPLMDSREVAQFIGRQSPFAYKSINRMVREGRLKAAGHDGKRFLFKLDDVMNMLEVNLKGVLR